MLKEWFRRRTALRELRSLNSAQSDADALDDNNFVRRAKVSIDAGDLESAEKYWEKALVVCKGLTEVSRDSIAILLALKRLDEAETLMKRGIKNASQDPHFVEGLALVAERKGDLVAALELWRKVQRKWPDRSVSYIHGAFCLREMGRSPDADALLETAYVRCPSDHTANVEWARIPDRKRDWNQSCLRWHEVWSRFGSEIAAIGLVRSFFESGRFDEADQHARQAVQVFRQCPPLWVDLARIAEQRGDVEAALDLWKDCRRRFPQLPNGYQEGVTLLRALKRFGEAEDLMQEAANVFPAEAWPVVELACLAHVMADWPLSLRRWSEIRERWPDRRDGYLSGAEAAAALGLHDQAEQLRSGGPGHRVSIR